MLIVVSGKTSRRPFAMFSATSRALSEPLNLSGAIKILTTRDCRAAHRLPVHTMATGAAALQSLN
jgi:hypothetical protein